MSIINDALKKTGQYIQLNAAKDSAPLNKKPPVKLVLLYTLILLAGLFLGNIIFTLLRTEIKPAPVAVTSPITAPITAPAAAIPAAVLPTPPVQSKQDFILNGIFYSDNDGYALINNQIVRENDTVDGATVVKITVNTAELVQEGNTITLSTRR